MPEVDPLSACLARMVAEVPGFPLFLAQANGELLLPGERGGSAQHTAGETVPKTFCVLKPTGSLWPSRCHSCANLLCKRS